MKKIQRRGLKVKTKFHIFLGRKGKGKKTSLRANDRPLNDMYKFYMHYRYKASFKCSALNLFHVTVLFMFPT